MDQQTEQPKKEAISLLRVLAQGSTDKSRELVKAHGLGDAKSYSDLEEKLAQVYKNAPDKVEIEKEFVRIHPHTEFILKYNQPAPQIIEKITPIVGADEKKANCDGCSLKSAADGKNEIQIDKMPVQVNHTPMVIGAVAIVAVIALYLHHNKR